MPVLFFPFPLLSHYTRMLALAGYLSEQFEIVFVDAPAYRGHIHARGMATVPGRHFDARRVLADVRRFSFDWLEEDEIVRQVEAHRALLRRLRPALVISDTVPTVRIAAQAEGIPHVALLNAYMSRYYALSRPVPSMHPAQKYRQCVPEPLFAHLARLAEREAFRRIHRPFARLRARLGLPPVANYLEELEGDHTLICDLPEIFPLRRVPPDHTVIGPLIFRGQRDEADLLARRHPERPVLLLTVGSSGEAEAFRVLLDPVFREFQILVTGNHPWAAGQPHIIQRAFVNLPAIMERVEVVLTHGGNGSLYQALAGGVPVLCRPVLFEQEWNVHRVVEEELGAWLPEAFTARELLGRVHHWRHRKRRGRLALMQRRIAEMEGWQSDLLRVLVEQMAMALR